MLRLTVDPIGLRLHALPLVLRSTVFCAAYEIRCFAGIPKIKNLIPEDTPELREWKEREKRVVKEQMTRSKLSDAKSALTEKVRRARAT